MHKSPQNWARADLENAPQQRSPNLFDNYPERYHSVLSRALAPSGEAPHYFARSRVQYLRKRLQGLGLVHPAVLDFGCGTGGSVPFLRELLHPIRILGVDTSSESLQRARQEYGGEGIEFANSHASCAPSEFQLAFCNGVFHHIEPAERPAALRYVYDSLAPGGIFAFWENNPWNPATRYIMGRCEFDDEVLPISSIEARKLLVRNGFEVLGESSHFYFPRWLRWFRVFEPILAHFPLGAQYMLLARKPD